MKAIQIYFGALLAIFLLTFSSCGKNDDFIDEDDDTQEIVENFRIVRAEFTEKEELSETFDGNVISRRIENRTALPVISEFDIFENVRGRSIFLSDDPRAFNWTSDEEIFVQVPGLPKQLYQQGTVEIPRTTVTSSRMEVPPRTIILVSGVVTYSRRVFSYTLTLEGIITGKRFQVSGTWTHIDPIGYYRRITSEAV